jgi:hypothetical protein
LEGLFSDQQQLRQLSAVQGKQLTEILKMRQNKFEAERLDRIRNPEKYPGK